MAENGHIKSDIPAYVTGQLSESRRRELEAHAASCDSCRSALNKAKAKAARQHRQALKTAVPDRVPNLLLARLGKQAGLPDRPSRTGWIWLGSIIFLIGAAFWIVRSQTRPARLVTEPTSGVSASTATETVPQAFVVDKSSPSVITGAAASAEAARASEAGNSSASGAPAAPQSWAGQESGIKEFREVVVRNRATWRALWAEMGQPTPAPVVDFNSVIIVGLFGGEKTTSGYQITLSPPQEEPERAIIFYKILPPAPAHGNPGLSHPYALMTIPRVPKRVVFAAQPA